MNKTGSEFSPLGINLFGEPIRPRSPVAQKFIIPPFSVLSARDGDWQERKRAWLGIGLKSEVGRSCAGNSSYQGRLEGYSGTSETCKRMQAVGDGPSVFDPVLCELAYRWFSGSKSMIVDPFAGGSVRGIVAAMLGRYYWGSDLSEAQIAANRAQALELLDADGAAATCYVHGDSADTLAAAPMADMLFSCPPYGDLERYSDDPADLSTLEWPRFLEKYRKIVALAVGRLKPDRFACFVVGDYRAPNGSYRNFVGETIRAFIDAGAELYNDAVLVTAVGSGCMRLNSQFSAGRKLVKTHQNVLVFVKGDWRKATAACADKDGE